MRRIVLFMVVLMLAGCENESSAPRPLVGQHTKLGANPRGLAESTERGTAEEVSTQKSCMKNRATSLTNAGIMLSKTDQIDTVDEGGVEWAPGHCSTVG
jgi:uncharacterized lipoprotein NlpE involved in copper resistance